jgi:hypothetical protein
MFKCVAHREEIKNYSKMGDLFIGGRIILK